MESLSRILLRLACVVGVAVVFFLAGGIFWPLCG